MLRLTSKIQGTKHLLYASRWSSHLAAVRNSSHLLQRTLPKYSPVKRFFDDDNVSRTFFSTTITRKHAHVDQQNNNTSIFSKTVLQCENYIDIQGVCPDNKLIGASDAVNEAMGIIKANVGIGWTSKEAPENLSGGIRVSPLGISRLARGGKSTLLRLVFARLKEEGYAPVLLNFNGRFRLSHDETPFQGFLRVLATSLGASPDIASKITQKQILDHIDSADNTHKGVVLLVDELNKLQYPIGDELGIFLKDYFLDKAGRYLVFTTHRPMDVDTPFSTDSGRNTISLTQPPQTSDMEKINAMPDCDSVSASLAVYYGRIPSLIFSTQHAFQTDKRAESVLLNSAIPSNSTTILATFIASIFNGKITGTNLDSLGVLSNDKMKWPPCYIGPILKHFALQSCIKLDQIIQRLLWHSTEYKSGKDWEFIVHMAVILHCMNTQLNHGPGPLYFDYIDTCSKVHTKELPPRMESCDEAKSYICEEFRKIDEGGQIFLVTIPQHDRFEMFDGFISFGDAKKHKTIGYQCKLKNAYPTKEVPDWLERGYLIRGGATIKKGVHRFMKWEYMTEKEVGDFLGREGSLASLYPNSWPKFEEIKKIAKRTNQK